MVFLCVTNKDLADRLISSGSKLFRQSKDIKGKTVWFFESEHLSFDIGDAMQNGDAFFSTSQSVVF